MKLLFSSLSAEASIIGSVSETRHGVSVVSTLFLLLLIVSAGAFAKNVVISSVPIGANVILDGEMKGVCKALKHGAPDGKAPCAFSFKDTYFPGRFPGGNFVESNFLAGPLGIVVSAEGYTTKSVLLTQDEPSRFKWTEPAGKFEATYFVIKSQSFEVHLEKESCEDRSKTAMQEGIRLFNEGKFEEAVREFDRASACGAPESKLYHYRCMANFQLRRFDPALKDCEQFTSLDPKDDSGWNDYGLVSQAAGHDEDAIKCFTHALQLNPKNVTALRDEALSHEHLAQFTEALSDYKAALSLDPHDAEALVHRADLYNRLGECVLAERDADVATQSIVSTSGEKRGEAFEERGASRLCQGHYDAAMADFAHSVALYPAWVWPVVKRCEAYRLMSQPAKALEECNEAIRKQPDLGFAFATRAEVYLKLRRYTDAFDDAQKAGSLTQKDAWIYDIEARANEGLGRWDVATADYDEALRIEPDRILSRFRRALARRITNNPEGSQQDLLEVKRLLSGGSKISASDRDEIESGLKALAGTP